ELPGSGTVLRPKEVRTMGARLLPPLLFLLAFLGALLRALAMAGADLVLQLHLRAGHESAGLAQTAHHLDPLPQAHARHLLHHRPHLAELPEELLDLVRLDAGPRGDTPAPAQVDDVRVRLLLQG